MEGRVLQLRCGGGGSKGQLGPDWKLGKFGGILAVWDPQLEATSDLRLLTWSTYPELRRFHRKGAFYSRERGPCALPKLHTDIPTPPLFWETPYWNFSVDRGGAGGGGLCGIWGALEAPLKGPFSMKTPSYPELPNVRVRFQGVKVHLFGGLPAGNRTEKRFVCARFRVILSTVEGVVRVQFCCLLS